MRRGGRLSQAGAWRSTPQSSHHWTEPEMKTQKNQYGPWSPTYCQETSVTKLQPALQHIKPQIKLIRAGSYRSSSKEHLTTHRDRVPKVKALSRGSKTTWS